MKCDGNSVLRHCVCQHFLYSLPLSNLVSFTLKMKAQCYLETFLTMFYRSHGVITQQIKI